MQDYWTSRWSSRHFAQAIRDTVAVVTFERNYGFPPKPGELMGVDPAKHWHNFFVVIGFDQLLHQLTFALTLWWVVNYAR